MSLSNKNSGQRSSVSRFFQVIDEDSDDLITFKEFAQGLGIVCKGELHRKLEFMYRMHVLTNLPDGGPSDNESIDSCTEATEAVDELERSSDEKASEATRGSDQEPNATSGLSAVEENPVRTLLRRMEVEAASAEEKKSEELPRMNQVRTVIDWIGWLHDTLSQIFTDSYRMETL